jgi:hypothetical protein
MKDQIEKRVRKKNLKYKKEGSCHENGVLRVTDGHLTSVVSFIFETSSSVSVIFYIFSNYCTIFIPFEIQSLGIKLMLS